MKHLYTFLFVAISATTFAQGGNLQFNKVINISGLTPGGNVFTTVTVPTEKVWKITSSSWLSSTGIIISSSYNMHPLCIGPFLLNGWRAYNGTAYNPVKFPIWLEEGDYDVKFCNYTYTISNYTYAISGIEFNIIP